MTDALAMCYSYLVQKRIEWTNYLEKLMVSITITLGTLLGSRIRN